jgi:hypothetical protein
MAGDKEEQEQTQHIPTEAKQDEQEEGSQGTGGLLSMVGDPAGTSTLLPITNPNPNPKPLLTPSKQAKSSAPPSAPSAHPSKKASQAPSAMPSAALHAGP